MQLVSYWIIGIETNTYISTKWWPKKITIIVKQVQESEADMNQHCSSIKNWRWFWTRIKRGWKHLIHSSAERKRVHNVKFIPLSTWLLAKPENWSKWCLCSVYLTKNVCWSVQAWYICCSHFLKLYFLNNQVEKKDYNSFCPLIFTFISN